MALIVDTSAFSAGVRLLAERVELATELAAKQAAIYVEGLAKAEITGGHPKGTPTPSAPGSPPTNITGTLRRSITASEPTRLAAGAYSVRIGPTVVYGRAVELGGPNWPAGVSYPYMQPATEKASDGIEAVARAAWAAAIRG